jgi:hypothetical protein
MVSHGSIGSVATAYGMDNRGVGVKNFHFSISSRPVLASTQPPMQWVPGLFFFPGIKQQGCEAEHSPPTSAEVKKTWTYTSTPPYVFMA